MQSQPPLLDEPEMLKAIRERDVRYDERFVFGVLTTGIFCRPSCASRAAKQENIRFFNNNAAALSAGFRPCKRCTPENSDPNFKKLIKLARYIEDHADEKLTLQHLAKRYGLSPSRFHEVFKQTFGISPKAYQNESRLRRFKSSLKEGEGVTDATFASGYGSSSRMYGQAAKNIGMSPSAYRKGGQDEYISYAYRQTSLGVLLIAATNKGVCFAQFDDQSETLIQQLHDEFPNATIETSNNQESIELDRWIDAIDKYLSEAAPRPELPLDLRGTAFQIKVWQFLLSTSEGQVFSYGDVAKGISQPAATRAAASACGKNRIAVLVPCHRVLRANGNLGGYRWGPARKRTLLDLERNRNSEQAKNKDL